MDMAYFPTVEGSMTSEGGQTFMLHVKRPTGGDQMLGFPHSEIPNIVENAAMQAAHGRNAPGRKTQAAFKTTSFQVGRSENGESVLAMTVGAAGKIVFFVAARYGGAVKPSPAKAGELGRPQTKGPAASLPVREFQKVQKTPGSTP